MKMWMAATAAASVMCMSGNPVHASTTRDAPGVRDLTPAVKAFLVDHGDLCLAWYTWPRELSAEQQRSGLNEAVQLPVLEHLGLVTSTDAPSGGTGKLYSLTAKGQRYYVRKKRATQKSASCACVSPCTPSVVRFLRT